MESGLCMLTRYFSVSFRHQQPMSLEFLDSQVVPSRFEKSREFSHHQARCLSNLLEPSSQL